MIWHAPLDEKIDAWGKVTLLAILSLAAFLWVGAFRLPLLGILCAAMGCTFLAISVIMGIIILREH